MNGAEKEKEKTRKKSKKIFFNIFLFIFGKITQIIYLCDFFGFFCKKNMIFILQSPSILFFNKKNQKITQINSVCDF